MTRLAGNMRMRLLAVLMLLALRPCVIFLTAQFLSSQSGTHSRIEYIDDDTAVQHVALSRRAFLVAASPPTANSPLASGSSAIHLFNSESRFSDLVPPTLRIGANFASAFGSRAPPL